MHIFFLYELQINKILYRVSEFFLSQLDVMVMASGAHDSRH